MSDDSIHQIPYCCRAVTTQQAKGAASETVTKELTQMANDILSLPSREDKLRKLQQLKISKQISAETLHFLEITALREIQHFHFMNYVMSCKIAEFTKEVRDTRNKHDFSKDELFYFSASAFFDGNVRSKEMEDFKDSELKRHYTLEAHHPEFELYNERECQQLDIAEMAIDRLARNVQFGDGIVNLNILQKFKPVFPKGDNEAKQAFQWQCCLKYMDIIQAAFHEMFPDTKDWQKK